MKEIHLLVPDSKANKIVSFALSAGATLLEETPVPEWQKQETRKRLEKANAEPQSWLDWDEIKDTFVARANL